MRKLLPLLLLVGCLLFDSALFAAQQNDGTSPSGKIHFELRPAEGETHSIYLTDALTPAEPVKLCGTLGWGSLELHFSPSDEWLVVQDGGASLGIGLRLFRRTNGLHYSEVEDAGLDRKAENLALATQKASANHVLSHRYARVIAWSADSQTVLVRLSGYTSGIEPAANIASWLGIYDLQRGTYGFDLAAFNKAGLGLSTAK